MPLAVHRGDRPSVCTAEGGPHAQQHPCPVHAQERQTFPSHWQSERLGLGSKEWRPVGRRQGYGVEHVAPRQRQQRDVDAEGHDGQVAVEQPAQHLEHLRGPGPPVHPGGFGEDQLVPAGAAVRRGRAPQTLTEAAHLGRGGGTQKGEDFISAAFNHTCQAARPPSQCKKHICWGNELGK